MPTCINLQTRCFVSNIMPVKRFKKLLQAFHVNDNMKAAKRGDPNFDKLHKIRPLLTSLNYKFQSHCVSSSSQSIDEVMIIFKGSSTIKQYMPMKPVKRGFKVWVHADSETGYVYQFDLYTGKADCSESSPGTGLGSRVVLSLTHSLQKSGTHVTFDNFFCHLNFWKNFI